MCDWRHRQVVTILDCLETASTHPLSFTLLTSIHAWHFTSSERNKILSRNTDFRYYYSVTGSSDDIIQTQMISDWIQSAIGQCVFLCSEIDLVEEHSHLTKFTLRLWQISCVRDRHMVNTAWWRQWWVDTGKHWDGPWGPVTSRPAQTLHMEICNINCVNVV